MTLFSIGIRDDGEVLTVTEAPHQGDDCDGLVYRATNEEGHDVFLFFIKSWSQGEAVRDAREIFVAAEYVALDPMWQPGSIWPDTADATTPEQACIQIYSEQMGRGYITTVPTHGRVNPFIDHFSDRIMWAYMRDIEARCCKELTEANERGKEYRRRQAEEQARTLHAGEPTGTVAETCGKTARHSEQLFLDFG